MGRRIETEYVEGLLGRQKGNASSKAAASPAYPPDDYLGRLLKYIPAELVGLYLAARGTIPASQPDIDVILWSVATATWLLVPIYLYFATSRRNKRPLWWQIALATLAFPVWLFAIGGRPVTSLSWYGQHQFVGSLILMFVTVVFGFKKP